MEDFGLTVELAMEVPLGHIWIYFKDKSPEDPVTHWLEDMREVEESQVVE